MDHHYYSDNERRGGYVCGNYYCITHVVRQGDTLYKLSREYGLKVSALMMANPFVDIYNLRVGDELCIPRLRGAEPMPASMPVPDMENTVSAGSAEPSRTAGPMPENAYRENDRVIDAEMQMQMGNVKIL